MFIDARDAEPRGMHHTRIDIDAAFDSGLVDNRLQVLLKCLAEHIEQWPVRVPDSGIW